MEIKTLKIGDKIYKVKIAKTDEEKETGLMNQTSLPENEGMLFEFEDETINMWMKDTLIPLDIVFINSNLEVISVKEGIPESEGLLTEDNVLYVLEVNANSGIKVGDEIDFQPDSKVKTDKMVVLDSEGNSQMELEGGERIFSRPNTKTLIKFAKKAASSKSGNDYKALGKRLFKFLTEQDNRPQETVELKN